MVADGLLPVVREAGDPVFGADPLPALGSKLADGHVVIETDIGILQSLAERVETVFPETRMYNPVGMVDDFAHQIVKELDFTRDGRNADRMSRNFRGVPGIRFPKIYWEYTSPKVMAMEFIEGVRIDDPEANNCNGT